MSIYWPRTCPLQPQWVTRPPPAVTVSGQIRFFLQLIECYRRQNGTTCFPLVHTQTLQNRVCASSFKLCVCIKLVQTLGWNADTVSQLRGKPQKSFSVLKSQSFISARSLQRFKEHDFTMILQRAVKCVSSKIGYSPYRNRSPLGAGNSSLALSL